MLRTVMVLLMAIGVCDAMPMKQSNLLAECSPVETDAAVSPLTTEKTGVTADIVDAVVKSKFHVSNMPLPYDYTLSLEYGQQVLVVLIDYFGGAASIKVRLDRHIKDLGYGVPGYATVWHGGVIQVFGSQGDPGQILLRSVAKQVDIFMDEYMKVNKEVYGEGHAVSPWCN